MSEELKLRKCCRLVPEQVSMGDLKEGDLFTLQGGREDPYEDGRDIYLAQSDAWAEKPEGNHGIAAVPVGRREKGEDFSKGIKGVRMTLVVEMEDGTEQDRSYEIHPNTFNLAEARNPPTEEGEFVHGPKRVMVMGDVL